MRTILRNMRYPLLRTREFFQYWLFDMSDALEYFIASLPVEVGERLDYSPESLDVLEAWLLARYSSIEAMLDRYELTRTDDIGRYIGEVFRKQLGGKWDVELGNPRKAFFELPYLQGTEEHLYVDCPLTIGTAAVDRRTGTFCRELFDNAKSMTPEHYQEVYGHLQKSKTVKKSSRKT